MAAGTENRLALFIAGMHDQAETGVFVIKDLTIQMGRLPGNGGMAIGTIEGE